jgi:hypothetical protein
MFTRLVAAAALGLASLAPLPAAQAEEMMHFGADPEGEVAMLEAFYGKLGGLNDAELDNLIYEFFSVLAARSGEKCDLMQEELNDPAEEAAASVDLLKTFGIDAEPSAAAAALFGSPRQMMDFLDSVSASPDGAALKTRIEAIREQVEGGNDRLDGSVSGMIDSGRLKVSEDGGTLTMANCS